MEWSAEPVRTADTNVAMVLTVKMKKIVKWHVL